MKKTIVLLITLCLILSCNKLCKTGQKVSDITAKAMQSRWKCDYQLAYNFLSKPVDKYICTDESKFSVPGAALAASCKIIVDAIAPLGGLIIAGKFKCDADLVTKDLKATDNLCTILALF